MQTLRPAHLRGRRMRRASRHRLRPGRAAVRDGEGVRQSSRAVRHRPLRRLGDLHQAQGHRHRSLLGRRFHGRRGHRGDRAARRGRAASTRSSSCKDDKHRRRRAVRRHGRRRLVLPAAARRAERRRHPRSPDVRPDRTSATAATRARTRPPRCPTHGSLRLQRRVQGHHLKAIKDKGLFTLDDVRKHTKASSLVRLVHRAGRADPRFDRRRRLLRRSRRQKPMCGCTDRTHEEVREAIREQQLLSICGRACASSSGARRTAARAAGRRSTTT